MGYVGIKDTGGKSPPSKEKKGDVYLGFQPLFDFLSFVIGRCRYRSSMLNSKYMCGWIRVLDPDSKTENRKIRKEVSVSCHPES